MKHIFLYILIFLSTTLIPAQVTILESGGWLESAFVTWEPVPGAESYNVYYSGEGITDEKIDDYLIRSYGAFLRADIVGIAEGTYTINVVPVIGGEEDAGTESGPITVILHDRTGFAFSNGRSSGAYKTNGTLKDGALILYITEKNKNTISINVEGANENPCVGLQEILDGFKKGKDLRPLSVRLVGHITDLEYMLKGDVVIENKNNEGSYITFEGIGDDAVADGWGLRVKNATNIEIRNIGFMNCDSDEGDNIGLQQNNYHIWVHHCDLFYGHAGSDADQAKGDGALDCKRSGNVTISYNHFWDSGKSNLLGNGIEDPEYLTYHHNWHDHSDSRHPRVRSHSVHVYNNYYDGNSKYGVGSTNASSVFVEANYFRNCKFPMMISMQGSDVFDEGTGSNDYSDQPTFSKEDGGIIKAFNNFMTGQQRFVGYGDDAYPNPTVDFDAIIPATRDEMISSDVSAFKGGSTYNNFDIDDGIMYSYIPDSPEMARDNVMMHSGRMFGGDLQWEFNDDVDDTSYDVIPELKSILTGYSTGLVYIQAEGEVGTGTNEVNTDMEPVLYPNPAGNTLHVSGVDVMEIQIYSTTGSLLLSSTDRSTEIDLSGLTPGVYIAGIKTPRGQFNELLVVQ